MLDDHNVLAQDLGAGLSLGGLATDRVLTDGGSEFRGTFKVTYRALGIQHTPRNCGMRGTNGLVERLQGTVVHEHWRIQFRRP